MRRAIVSVLVASLVLVAGSWRLGATDGERAVPIVAKSSGGTVTFTPLGDQSKIPPEYRLEPHEFAWEMSLHKDHTKEGFQIYKLTFPSAVTSKHAENNTVHCEWYRPVGEGPFPAAVVLDILGGDQMLARVQSTYLAKKGIACLFVQMAYYGPRRPKNSKVRLLMPDIDHTLGAVRQTVLDVRRAAAWLAAQPGVDPERLGVIGTSLGSFMGTLTAEMEPRFRKVAIVLGGGGVVDAFYDHPKGATYRQMYEGIGGSKAKLQAIVAIADPLTRAENLRDRQVIMIGASRDEVVPPAATRRMWEAIGRPKIIWYDATHTGAITYILQAMVQVIEHFKR
jgi:dienelactone hydrolase